MKLRKPTATARPLPRLPHPQARAAPTRPAGRRAGQGQSRLRGDSPRRALSRGARPPSAGHRVGCSQTRRPCRGGQSAGGGKVPTGGHGGRTRSQRRRNCKRGCSIPAETRRTHTSLDCCSPRFREKPEKPARSSSTNGKASLVSQ